MLAAYVRVSTASQNERSQKAEIRKWAEGNGHVDIKWYVDKESGDTLDRPAFKQLQADIFNGTVSAVAVWKLDRLSRSLKDGIDVLCDWLGRGIRIVSVTQLLDFSGPTGKLVASVLLACAELEQQTRKERQAVGIALAKAEGKYRGRQPGALAVDPAKIRRLHSEGKRPIEIAKILGISRQTVWRYLRMPQ